MLPIGVLYMFSVVGMIAGALGWYVARVVLILAGPSVPTAYEPLVIFGIVGFFLGPTVCAMENAWMSGIANSLREAAVGLLTGVVGGLLGGWIGGLIFSMFAESNVVVARLLAFLIIGTTLGIGQALYPFSFSKTVWGLIGGFAGGILAGLLFLIANNLGMGINIVQAMSLTLMGGIIAIAIHAIVSLGAHVELVGDDENITKYDSRFRSTLYRDQLNVFGNGDPGRTSAKANLQIRANDSDIDPVHAILEWDETNQRYLLSPYWVVVPEAQQQGVATYVNNKQISKAATLKHGDVIQLGQTKFHFRLRASAQGSVQ
jgi:FHA domain